MPPLIDVRDNGDVDRVTGRLANLGRRCDPAIRHVHRLTAIAIAARYRRDAPRRTGALARSVEVRETARGVGVRVGAPYGKPVEARAPIFNDAIKAGMKGIRGRRRDALRAAYYGRA